MKLIAGSAFITLGSLAIVAVLALAGCDSEAQRIREINETLATPAAERTPLSTKIDSVEVRDGDCINSTLSVGIRIDTVVIVPCVGTWQYRALNTFEVADVERYPGKSFFERRAYESCDRRTGSILFPQAEAWSFGDRKVRCLQISFGFSVADPAKLDRLVKSSSLGFGECYKEAPETGDVMVELVDCSGEWQYRVLNSFEVADSDRYPGESFFHRRAFESCDRRHSLALFPLAESWSFGDRKVNCIQDSLGLSVADPAKLDRLVNINSLGFGECYNEAPEAGDVIVELIDCSGEWQYRIINSFDVAYSDRYPGESFFWQRAQESCDRRYSFILFPQAEAWSFGDRKVNCLQLSFGLSVADPARLDRLVYIHSLNFGDCYNEAPETDDVMVELVDCSGEWQYRVINSFDVDDSDRYPGESFFEQRAQESCDRRYSFILFPQAEVWSFGDRKVNCIQDSLGLSVADPAKLDRLVYTTSVGFGECFNEAPEAGGVMVELVDCSGEWQYRVLNSFDVDDSDRYPGESFFGQRARESCDRSYAMFLYPSRQSWELGDRTVTCLQTN